MSPTQIIVTVLLIAVAAAIVVAAMTFSRRRALRDRFGPEYDRLVAEQDSRSAAERELRERERRHAELTLKPLSESSRGRYAARWEEIQARFVDSPGEAVGAADQLVGQLIAERGYPTGDHEEQLAVLSVDHARTLNNYRDAHEIHLRNERGEASTEQLRQAVVHYRALFADLLGTEPVGGARASDRSHEPRADDPQAHEPAESGRSVHEERLPHEQQLADRSRR